MANFLKPKEMSSTQIEVGVSSDNEQHYFGCLKINKYQNNFLGYERKTKAYHPKKGGSFFAI